MQQPPILSRTSFRTYWNNHLQPGISFDFNDALRHAFNVYDNGINCPKNDVYFVSSLGTKYVHDKATNTFKQA